MKNRLPNYRFNNFLDSWNIEKVSTIANEFKSGGTPSTKVMNYWNGKIPWLQSSDIQKDILFGVKPQKFISEEGLQNSSAKLISKNSIAIVTRVGVGKLAIIDRDYTTSQDFLSLSDLNGDIQFLVYSIYRMLQKESIQLQGTSIKGITKEELLSKKIGLPSISEQFAIGSLFRTLDDLLASYKDNLANYQSLKATMLSKMFPKAGQTVPEIRLDGFEGEWENKILSEVTNITMGQSPKSENYTDNPNDYILVQGNADIKDKQVVPRLWTTEVTKMAEIGDIILTVRAPVGDIGKTDYNVVIGRGVAAIKGNDFIFYTLEKMKMTGFWNKFSTGSTFESISSNDIKEAIIQIPTLEEQQAIGAYFSNLDNLINSYQEKISQLETLKKKLLQDMFI
ncbi:restriction endonuclease subunit S [Streptococcus thermophilus]|nr:restriction endonuclease subunit S [Streptococcus thermophilus]